MALKTFTLFLSPSYLNTSCHARQIFLAAVLQMSLCFMAGDLFAQTQENLPAQELKKFSIEELMNIEVEVFSVSKRPQKLTEVSSAIQVITGEDIRRSGA